MFDDWKNIHSWRNPRNKRFWGVTLILLYSLLGFVATPMILQDQIPKLSQQLLKHDAVVKQVSFNPWSLRLQLDELSVLDEQGAPLLVLKQFVANLDVTSIWHFALDFHEIAVVAPHVYLVRYSVDDSNIGRLLDDISAGNIQTEPPSNDSDTRPLRLLIGNFSISDGVIDIRDEVPNVDFTAQIAPIDISMNDFNTLPGLEGEQLVSLKTENGVELTWAGSIDIAPLKSNGRLELHGSPLPLIDRYFEDQLGVGISNCCLDIALDYRINTLASGSIEAAIDNFSLDLLDLTLTEKEDGETPFTLPALRVRGGSLRWPQNTLHLETITLEQPQLVITREADKSLNLMKMWLPSAGNQTTAQNANEPSANGQRLANQDPPAQNASEDSAKAAAPSLVAADIDDTEQSWAITVGASRLQDMTLTVNDRSLNQAGQLQWQAINLELLELSNQPQATAQLSASLAAQRGGSVKLAGTLSVSPDLQLDTHVNIDALSLSGLQPWISEVARIKLTNGGLFIDGNISSSPLETLLFNGNLAVKELAVADSTSNAKLLTWQSLAFQQVRLGLDDANLEIAGIQLLNPFAKLVIFDDGSTNVQKLAVAQASAIDDSKLTQTDDNAKPLRLRVGSTLLSGGALDFEDKSLPLPFRVLIQDFSGTVSASDSFSSKPSALDFEGTIGEFGLAKITGDTRLSEPAEQTDIVANFSNINMPELSGYTAQFAGRKIASGKLSLNLEYLLEDNTIKGDNSITMKDFTLGEDVESEDAVDLPLDLAIALMTDASGVIDVDLQVSGDIDSPDFTARGLIFKAFVNLITKAVTSPFKLLGALVGGDDSDLESIDFQAGRSDLQPPQREKLEQLITGLTQRPSLQLAVPGIYILALDKPAIQKAMLDEQVNVFLQGLDDTDDQQTITKRGIQTLEKLAKTRLPELELKALRTGFTMTDPNTGDTLPDDFAYLKDLRQRLEVAQPVSQQQLTELATQRQQSIIAYLTAPEKLAANRIKSGLVEAAEEADKVDVGIELGIMLAD
tara:strand:- start:628 stop:3693 length:3066 start_codon:yes stop_codon:yes gene_type:complete